jgi:hypothetical protein
MSKYYVKNMRSGQYLKRNDGNRHHPVIWVREKEEIETDDLRLRLPTQVQDGGNAIIVDEDDIEVTANMAQMRGNYYSRTARPDPL